MSAIILLDAQDAEFVEILQTEDGFGNMVFESVDAADLWLQKNAQMGWITRIINCDD
jgi:hypothetical protein